MTQPSPHGYPDWGRYAASADKKIDTQAWAVMNVATDFGPYFVGDVEWVNITFTSTAQHHTVAMQYNGDPVVFSPLHNQNFVSRSVGISYLSFPVLGPWLVIEVTPSAAGATGSFILTTAKRGATTKSADTSPNILIQGLGVAVGAGATVTLAADQTVPGPVIWNLIGVPATWLAVVNSVDAPGARRRLDTTNQTNGVFSRQLFLPYEPIEVSFTNQTGAASTFSTTVMAQPNWPMGG